MANVFGNPITDSTLEAMAEYAGRKITAADRARVAINMKTANMKDTNARTYVEKLKQQWGNGVSTLCLVYNATGNTMTFVRSKDWYGHIGPGPYPIQIQNGQWGAFLHVKESGALSGSNAAVVYRGKIGNGGKDCDYMMAWDNPWRRTAYDNSVWAETREVNHFTDAILDYIYEKLYASRYNYRDSWGGCLSIISTGSDSSPVVEAMFTLDSAITCSKSTLI